MDLRVYYQKLRKIEADITEPSVVVVSQETPDGGVAGVKTDVPRNVAAKMIAEDRAILANPEEASRFRKEVEDAWKAAQAVEEVVADVVKPARAGTKAKKS